MLRSPIQWFGGKGQLVHKLLQYVPSHIYYCEVFGGGASLLFAKKPAKFEVYNDINSGLVCLFRVLRDPQKFQEFYRKVCLTPYSREEFYYCRDTWEKCEDEVEKAYRFFIVARMSFSGQFGESWSYALKDLKGVKSYLSIIEELPLIHKRIMTVQIEHLDWKECVRKYNDWGWDGWYYCDPPYYPDTRKQENYYTHEFTKEDHLDLVNWLLLECKVKVMLSGYDNPLYQKLEKHGWKKICWDVDCKAAGRTRQTQILGEGSTFEKNQRRQECIWINYAFELLENKQLKIFDLKTKNE